jgi:hypothetical protein
MAFETLGWPASAPGGSSGGGGAGGCLPAFLVPHVDAASSSLAEGCVRDAQAAIARAHPEIWASPAAGTYVTRLHGVAVPVAAALRACEAAAAQAYAHERLVANCPLSPMIG